MSGTRVLAIVAGLVFLTAVLPPALAWSVNQRRVRRATADLARWGSEVAGSPAVLGPPDQAPAVLCGAGGLPPAATVEARGWGRAREAGQEPAIGAPTVGVDPWGDCYLVDVATLVRTGRGLALSAGPDGVIETPYGALEAHGDDIGLVVTRSPAPGRQRR